MNAIARALYRLMATVRGLQIITGRMTTAGSSDPTKLTPAIGWTATRSASGNITVQLTQSYKRIMHVEAQLIGATGNTKRAVIISVAEGSLRTGGSFVIELQNTAGTAADQTGIDLTFVCYAAEHK